MICKHGLDIRYCSLCQNTEFCKLCGKTKSEETKSDYLRTIYIANDNYLYPGYFRPRLTEMEFYLLNKGEHTICSNRKQCQKRRKTNLNRTNKEGE